MARRLRPAVPASAELATAGPLASSGAAPDEAPSPSVPAQPGKPDSESTGIDGKSTAAAPEAVPADRSTPTGSADRPEADKSEEPANGTDKAPQSTAAVTPAAEATVEAAPDGKAAEAAADGKADTAAPDGKADEPTSTGKPGDTDTKVDLAPVAGAAPADGAAQTAPVAAVAPKRRNRIRVPFAHAVRRPSRQTAAAAARSVGAWSRRPSGRLTLPALLLLLVVAATGTAGAIIVPAIAPDRTPVANGSGEPTTDPDLELLPTLPGTAPTPTVSPGALPGLPQPVGRPADVLAGWAQQTGDRIGIPAVAVQAYGYAELVVSRTTPNCRLSWTTLAAIGLVESNHGRANGASLGPDGKAMPPIIGLPLDGQGGRQRIADTDGGRLDGDPVLDRAVGPMQFIPSTWAISGVDADNDGVKDPHDIDDAALAAANYLCSNGRNLSTSQDWWNAILSYNDVRQYAQAVFDAANRYGTASRA
ncbi:lytic transglycosylase domain-containing protein [Polymorphospora rubra]|uniref:lytic transglycosylase domain-containing protein n=1 Tax=Polymorphospora rubra TaxID=338584 RepID=UPI0033CE07A8